MKETVKLQLAQTESVRKNPCMKSWWFEVKSAETLQMQKERKEKHVWSLLTELVQMCQRLFVEVLVAVQYGEDVWKHL